MAGHPLRGAVTAWLALIALQALANSGTGQVSGAFAAIDGLVKRALDPKVPAIPDRRTGGGAGADRSQQGYLTPAQAAAAARASAAADALTGITGPGGALSGLPSLDTYVNGGGLPAGVVNNRALR